MILINKDEVNNAIDSILSYQVNSREEEDSLMLCEDDVRSVTQDAMDIVALVDRSVGSLEALAQCVQSEIAFIKRLVPITHSAYTVDFSVRNDLLMAELSIAADLLRKEIGDSPVRMGVHYSNESPITITVIMGLK